MTHSFRTALLSLALLAAFVRPGAACKCMERPANPCAAVTEAEAIFVARIISIVPLAPDDAQREFDVVRYVDVVVEEAFKGVRTGRLRLLQDGTSCAVPLAVGQRWLIYTDPASGSGMWFPGVCSRTQLVDTAADDLRFLRTPTGLESPTRLSGFIARHGRVPLSDESEIVPLSGTPVEVADEEGHTRRTKTDAAGVYELLDLPAGRYTITVDIPEHLELLHERNTAVVELAHPGCASADFVAFSTGVIAGRVVDATGRGVDGLYVNVVRSDMAGLIGQGELDPAYSSGDGGEYAAGGLAPGRYIVGVNMTERDPKLRTYAPGVSTPAQARIVDVGPGEEVDGIDVTLTQSMARIIGIILEADGRPVAGATARFYPPTGPPSLFIEAVTDAKGHFALDTLFHAVGEVTAFVTGDRTPDAQRSATVPVELREGKDTTVTIVMPPRQ